ncbi:zinc finger protein 624-like [Anopheles marshallii]|uniref:zinc finger protein 624-like n=1 Tax=Anopheles marshallii TaxID=1521116 RepID=UPI00237B2A8E|nr:zinc finger protein 624-like [Anopheles marshallii]
MSSSTGKEICGICGMKRLIMHRNLMKVKTKFSSTTVFHLLERFSERKLSHRTTNLVESGACSDCYAKLNDYDAAHTKALIIQQELTDLLQNGSLRIFEDVQELREECVDEDKHENKANEIKWVPHLEHPGEVRVVDDKKPTFSIAGLSTIRVSMKCNVCEELFNNIHDMKLHSHDEANCEEQLDMLGRESAVRSPTLVIETVKSERASPVNFDDDADDYMDYTISIVKEEVDEEEERVEYYSNAEDDSEASVKKAVQFKCFICEAKFESKHNLRVHFKTNHPSSSTEGNICKVCGISTKTRAALASHYGKHVRETQLTCELCNKKFTQRSSLQRHMAIHKGEKSYQCDLCGKQYLHYSSFYMHQLAHKNVRNKECNICGFLLRSNSHLKRHMRTHSGEKPFACPVCGQKFSQRYNMVQHQKTHKGIKWRSDKTFNCTSCDYISSRSMLMKRHMLKHHGKDMNTSECSKSTDGMKQEDGIATT